MRRAAFFFLCLGLTFSSHGQNLVPNGSFEELSECPVYQDEVYKAVGWYAVLGSPDLLNTCAIGDQMSVPSNLAGYQWPSSGNGYVQLISFSGSDEEGTGYREWVGRELSAPLEIGVTYYVSAKVSWTASWDTITYQWNGRYANDHMGFLFKTFNWQTDILQPLPNHAQFWSPMIVIDSVGWFTISGSFVADSAYTHVYFGNFYDDVQTNVTVMDTALYNPFAYNYVDDLCVTDDPEGCEVVHALVEQSYVKGVLVFPNPSSSCIHVRSKSKKETIDRISLFDLCGRQIMALELESIANEVQIDLSAVPAGIYVLEAALSGGSLHVQCIERHNP